MFATMFKWKGEKEKKCGKIICVSGRWSHPRRKRTRWQKTHFRVRKVTETEAGGGQFERPFCIAPLEMPWMELGREP
jgi:hypothetical protein